MKKRKGKAFWIEKGDGLIFWAGRKKDECLESSWMPMPRLKRGEQIKVRIVEE